MCPFKFVLSHMVANILLAQVCLDDVSILIVHAQCWMSDWQTHVQSKHALWSYFHDFDISPYNSTCSTSFAVLQALDSNFSMSSEIDDPLGMQHLFEEQPSDDSSNALAASAPARPANPWASVLQLSLQCLIRWLHSGKENLSRQHMDAIMCLLSQQVMPDIKSSFDAPTDFGNSQQHAVVIDGPSQLSHLLKELHQALLEEAMRDEAACTYIVGRVFMSPARLHDRNGNYRQQSSRADRLWQLAATCLMHNVQECVAMNQECRLAMDLWLDLNVVASSVGSSLKADVLLRQLAQPK